MEHFLCNSRHLITLLLHCPQTWLRHVCVSESDHGSALYCFIHLLLSFLSLSFPPIFSFLLFSATLPSSSIFLPSLPPLLSSHGFTFHMILAISFCIIVSASNFCGDWETEILKLIICHFIELSPEEEHNMSNKALRCSLSS